MKSHECNHVNLKLGQTHLIFFFERELENFVDTENEICLVNNSSSFSDAIDDLSVDSSMYTRRIEFRCLRAKGTDTGVEQDK